MAPVPLDKGENKDRLIAKQPNYHQNIPRDALLKLRPGGLMVIGGVQLNLLSTKGSCDVDAEQKWLLAWVNMLRSKCGVDALLLADAFTGVYCWLFLRKPDGRQSWMHRHGPNFPKNAKGWRMRAAVLPTQA